MKNPRNVGIAVATLMLVTALAAAAIVVRAYVFPPRPEQSAASDNSAPPIKVGILLSEFTATGPHWTRQPYGYEPQIRIVASLQDPSLRLIPVIEPGTAADDQLARILSLYFATETPLDASKAEDLKQLDVLVATGQPDMNAAVLSAIEQSVMGGMGFLQHGFGFVSPGFTPQIDRITGITRGIRGYSDEPVSADVLGSHPLLGDLSGQGGRKIDLIANGIIGVPSGAPLIRINNGASVSVLNPTHPRTNNEFLDPLYVAQLGQGKIVGVGFSIMREVPDALEAANHGRFYIHCVQWLAGKNLN
jgi:hypothetical protein